MLVAEVVMNVGLWVAGSFVAGILVGSGITALLRRGSESGQRIRQLRREYDQYQAEVARHFTQTGELLSRLRGAFEQLYGEVEDRATELVGEEALQRRLRDLERAPERSTPVPQGSDAPDADSHGADSSVTDEDSRP
jgi:uncharacterized membrane-anchored protein YhcB (DUF1043 family)